MRICPRCELVEINHKEDICATCIDAVLELENMTFMTAIEIYQPRDLGVEYVPIKKDNKVVREEDGSIRLIYLPF